MVETVLVLVTVTVTGAGQLGQAAQTEVDATLTAAEVVAAFVVGETRVNAPLVLIQLAPLGYE